MSVEVRHKLETQSWPIENVRPYENNAKIHTPSQIESIARSIRRFGWDQPIVVDGEGVIIKGHGRFEAAKSMGMKFVQVVVRTDLTAKEAHASRLADNRVAQSGIDTEKLHAEIVMLAEDEEIDLKDMGFTTKELEFLTEDIGAMDDTALLDAGVTGDEKTSLDRTQADLTKALAADVPLHKAFGFKSIPGADAPTLSQLQMHAEAETGQVGAAALVTWAKGIVGAE